MLTEDFNLKAINEDNLNYNEDGFYFKPHGREGHIYFIENKSITPISIEMPGTYKYDILVFGETEHIRKRYYPDDKIWEELLLEERLRIQNLPKSPGRKPLVLTMGMNHMAKYGGNNQYI